MSQQLVAKPQGIISEPNKVGQFPPGAFAFASNCAIRSCADTLRSNMSATAATMRSRVGFSLVNFAHAS